MTPNAMLFIGRDCRNFRFGPAHSGAWPEFYQPANKAEDD